MTYRNENIGRKARDKVTGFTGTVTSFCQHLTGCDQYCLRPECGSDSGKLLDGHWFDDNRLEWLDTPKITLYDEDEDEGTTVERYKDGPCESPPDY